MRICIFDTKPFLFLPAIYLLRWSLGQRPRHFGPRGIKFRSLIPITFCLQRNFFRKFKKLACSDIFISTVFYTLTWIENFALIIFIWIYIVCKTYLEKNDLKRMSLINHLFITWLWLRCPRPDSSPLKKGATLLEKCVMTNIGLLQCDLCLKWQLKAFMFTRIKSTNSSRPWKTWKRLVFGIGKSPNVGYLGTWFNRAGAGVGEEAEVKMYFSFNKLRGIGAFYLCNCI